MLGTNDLKHYRATYAADSARGAARLVETIRQSMCTRSGKAAHILLISPPEIRDLSPLLQFQFRGAESKSLEFSEHFRQLADETGCLFLDAAQVAEPSEMDGVHLDQESHEQLAGAIRAIVLSAFRSDR